MGVKKNPHLFDPDDAVRLPELLLPPSVLLSRVVLTLAAAAARLVLVHGLVFAGLEIREMAWDALFAPLEFANRGPSSLLVLPNR